MAYIPNSGSVVAFQGNPSVLQTLTGLMSTNASVITVSTAAPNQSVSGTVQADIRGSVATVIIGGSIAASFTPPANQSVSGTVGASIIGLPPVNVTNTNLNVSGSVVAWLQSTNASVITVGTAAPIQSVSGTVGASLIGLSPVSVSNFPTTQNVSGSVVAFQGTNPWTVVSSIAGGIFPISGSVAATIVGTPNVNTAGSVVAFQGGAPWANTNVGSVITVGQGSIAVNIIAGSIAASFTPPANQSVSGTVQVDVRSSVAVVIIGGSILTSSTANQSVSGTVNTLPIGTIVTSLVSTVPSSVLVGTSIFGQLPAGTAMIGSIAAYQGAVPWAVSGSVAAFQAGTNITSLVSTVPSSVQVGASIFGQLPAGTAMLGSVAAYQGAIPWTISSVYGNVSGSVVAFQGTSPFVVNFQNSSILSVPVGSTITVFQAPSIVGTYAEDAASASGDKGFLVMGARNDTLASVTSNDGDYSSHVVGPAGELISVNAPYTKWVQGTASMLTGTPLNGGSVQVIAAQGASIFTYITALQIANPSANNVWVRFDGATSSFIGFTMAPANGGSNIVIPNGWKTNANGAFTASVSGSSSVYVTATGFISKT